MDQKVSWAGGYVIVRAATVRDNLTADVIGSQLVATYPDGSWGYWKPFGELCSQTIESKGLPFQPELVRNMDVAQMKQAYDLYLELPKALQTRWKAALTAAESVTDYELGPVPLADNASPKA